MSLMILGFAFKDTKGSRDNVETKTIELSNFQHVSIEKGCSLSVQNSEESKFSYISSKDSILIKPLFKIENDTLFLSSTKNNMKYNGVVLYLPNIQSITGENCRISLREMDQEFLHINTKGTKVDIHQTTNIKKYELNLKQSSNLYCWNNFKGEELLLNIENSKLNLRGQHKLSKIKGQATNHSNIQLPHSKSYQLEFDESSNLRIY